MRWFTRSRLALRSIFRRQLVEDELQAELQFFVEQRTEQYRAAGASGDEAARLARRNVGSVMWIRDACRDARGARVVDELMDDARHGIRLIRRHAGFAAMSVALMAISIGVSASAIAVLDAVLLRGLPAITRPTELALISGVTLDDDRKGQSLPMFELLSRQREGVAQVFAYRNYGGLPGTIDGTTVPLRGIGVVGDYFEALRGMPVIRGRRFDSNSDAPEALISSRVWQAYFGNTADIVGRTFTMGTVTFSVAGVVGPEFLGLQPDLRWDVITPFSVLSRARGLSPAATRNQIVYTTVRLKRGVAAEQYQSRLAATWPEILRLTCPAGTTLEEWTSQRGARVVVESLRSGQAFTLVTNPGLPRALELTAALSTMLFLASCVTLALLVVARAARHQRDTAIRSALGGSRWRVVRPYLVESVCLSGLGCVAGLVIASWGSAYGAWYVPGDWHVSLMPWAAACAVLMAVVTATLDTGLVAYMASRGALRQVMQQTTQTTHAHVHLRTTLLTAQVVASAVLIYATLLYVDDVRRLARVPLGIDAQHLKVYQLVGKLPYRSLDADYFQQLESAIREAPGVESVGLGAGPPPLSYLRDLTEPIETTGRGRANGFVACVFPGVFATWRTPQMAGRDLQWTDRPAAVLTESLARRLYADETPLGRVIRTLSPKPVEYQVVGIVENMAFNGPRLGVRDVAFVPCLQRTNPFPSNYIIDVYVRSSTRGLLDLKRDVTSVVERLGAQYVMDENDQQSIAGYAVQQEHMLATVAGVFAGIVLFLTSVSLYAFATYMLTLRTRELAVRAALGASASRLVAALLGELFVVLCVGLVIGLFVVLGLHRGLQSAVGDLGPIEWQTPARVVGILSSVFIGASWWPAFRAVRLNLADGLRGDE